MTYDYLLALASDKLVQCCTIAGQAYPRQIERAATLVHTQRIAGGGVNKTVILEGRSARYQKGTGVRGSMRANCKRMFFLFEIVPD
jgi:hypothetical protein